MSSSANETKHRKRECLKWINPSNEILTNVFTFKIIYTLAAQCLIHLAMLISTDADKLKHYDRTFSLLHDNEYFKIMSEYLTN